MFLQRTHTGGQTDVKRHKYHDLENENKNYWGQGGEMTQALYAHMNNEKKKNYIKISPLSS
jgi:hypothetical protein